MDRVRLLLDEQLNALRQAAARLLQRETMTGTELQDIVSAIVVSDLEASVNDITTS